MAPHMCEKIQRRNDLAKDNASKWDSWEWNADSSLGKRFSSHSFLKLQRARQAQETSQSADVAQRVWGEAWQAAG